MDLLLRCGCTIRFQENMDVICPSHGSQGVARVLKARPPRIRGVATGPHCVTCDLPAHTARIVGSEPKD